MKKLTLLVFWMLCAASVHAQVTCDCKDVFATTIKPDAEFKLMATAAQQLGDAAVGLGIDLIKVKPVNEALKPDVSYNTLAKEVVPICLEINHKLDTAAGAAIYKLIGDKKDVTKSNFEQHKSVLACFALKERLKTAVPAGAGLAGKVDTGKPKSTAPLAGEAKKDSPPKPNNWWPIAFFALAAATLGGGIFFWKRMERLQKAIQGKDQDMSNMKQGYEAQIESLKGQIGSKPTPLPTPNPLPPVWTPPSQVERKEEAAKPVEKPHVPLRRIYLRPPNGNIFPKESESLRAYETYYMIDIEPDQKTGTLRLVNDTATLEQAFSMIDVLRSGCDLLGNNQPSSVGHASQTPGKVEWDDAGYWKIVNKIQLDW
jgi:hypothetical protein